MDLSRQATSSQGYEAHVVLNLAYCTPCKLGESCILDTCHEAAASLSIIVAVSQQLYIIHAPKRLAQSSVCRSAASKCRLCKRSLRIENGDMP